MKTLRLGTTNKVIGMAAKNDPLADWLNCIDARITYDRRRELGPVNDWAQLYDDGLTPAAAIEQAIKESAR
jgi:hypothetical protein